MKRPGEVVEKKNGKIRVVFCRPEACQSCGGCEGGKKQTSLWVRGQAEVGDIAVVDMPDRIVFQAFLIAYGMPLLCLLAGMVAGNLLFPGKDGLMVVGGALGLAVSLVILKLTEKKRSGNDGWEPKVTEIIPGVSVTEKTNP